MTYLNGGLVKLPHEGTDYLDIKQLHAAVYSSTHYALNRQCDYFMEDTFLTNIADKNEMATISH